MPDLLVRSFTPLRLACRPCFTQPSFSSFWALACAWILCSGRRSVTRVIQPAQLGRFKHYCAFHRFFSQARWNLDDLGHCVFQLLLPFCPEVLIGAVDDTLARKSGRHIRGAGMHHDPLRSTRKHSFFSFGHSWVVLSLHVCLYRKRKNSKRAPGRNGKPEKKQTGQATEKQYRTRPQLALEMIQVVARWLGTRKLRVLGDSEYAGGSISRLLPANADLISRMTMKAALFETPPAPAAGRGRRRKKGRRLPNPEQMAQNPGRSWIKTTVRIYGRKVKVCYQSIDALWYPSAGPRLLRIVVVRDPRGHRRDDCFFSTDLTLRPPQILEPFARRWPLEVCFRDVKQFLGFEDPQNRSSTSMTSYCCGTHSPGISSHRNQLSSGLGITARRRFPSKIFFEICGKQHGRKRFSATPDSMHTREKSFNPLQSGSKLLHKSAKRQPRAPPRSGSENDGGANGC